MITILVLLFTAITIFYFWYWRIDPAKASPSSFVKPGIDEKLITYEKVPTEEKIAIIGAGFCGLGINVALKRHGIAYDCFEAEDKLGGNWNNGVYETVHIISSKKTTEYKDFPMPNTYPEFPSAKQMLEYFENYAQHFKVKQNIQFNSKVISCIPVDSSGSKWKLIIHRIDSSTKQVISIEEKIYKGCIVANGHHWDMRMPSYEGQDKFSGEIIHSKQYKSPKTLVGKKVLVVGGGNSACDIAVESARFAKESHSSMRRGYWFIPRTIFGMPFVELMKPWMPVWILRIIAKSLIRIVYGRYERYGLREPDHNLFHHHPTINSELLHYIKLGDIRPHPDIKRFVGGKTVEFEDGKQVEFDLVVFCTGFYMSLPMFSSEIVAYKDRVPQLVNGVLSTQYRNMYVFGIGQPRYGAGPLITLGSDVIAKTILLQDKLINPIGKVLARLGVKPQKKNQYSADIIVDPFSAYRALLTARSFINSMTIIEKLLISLGLLK